MTVLKNEKGFSLLEVLIALIIMSGALVVVSAAWSTSQLRVKKMKLNQQAAFLLDYKMADIQRKYKDTITQLPEAEAGDFADMGKEYKDFTWTLTSKKFEMPNVSSLLSQNKNGADPMLVLIMDQMTEFFKQAAKEATVTIVYTFGKNKVQYSATTFLIDFNQQLPLPNLGAPGGP